MGQGKQETAERVSYSLLIGLEPSMAKWFTVDSHLPQHRCKKPSPEMCSELDVLHDTTTQRQGIVSMGETHGQVVAGPQASNRTAVLRVVLFLRQVNTP